MERVRANANAKTLYVNLFTGARQGFLSLDFVCTKGHDIRKCRCTGEEFRGKWLHNSNAAAIVDTWRLGVRSLVKLREAEINHYQVQTAGHIRDFIDYINKRSRR